MLTHHRSRLLLLLLTFIALYIRIHKIHVDGRVVWDETHFGGFTNNYIAGNFYLDVHPPLGKLLIAFLFRRFGYTGDFAFVSGAEYSSTVPFVSMRRVQAALGALLVPLTFIGCNSLRLPQRAAWMAATFIAFDTALIGISRIIVLDNAFLLVNAAVLCVFAHVNRETEEQKNSASCLVVLGLLLALTLSIKLTGLITVAFVGINTIAHLIRLCGKERTQMLTWFVQFAKRAFALGLFPLVIYMIVFWWHFKFLINYTPQAEHMGSEFNVHLNGSALQIQPEFIHHNSFVTIRANNYPFEYISTLKRLDSLTPEPSLLTTRLLKVECYFGIDLLEASDSSGQQAMRNGSLIHLHVPKSTLYISVLGFQSIGLADTNYKNYSIADTTWMILHHTSAINESPKANMTRPIATKFRLASIEHKCELAILHNMRDYTHGLSMDDQHSALACIPGRGTVWNFEHQLTVSDNPMANISYSVSRSFLKSFVSYNLLMRELNGMLLSDPDKYVAVESTAASWPFLTRPMPMVTWSGDHLKYMLIGNPVLWWGSAIVCIFIHPFLTFMASAITHRTGGRVRPYRPTWSLRVLWYFWAINYFPFFAISRTTYLHHYLPSLYFAILLLAAYLNEAIALASVTLAHQSVFKTRYSTERCIMLGIILSVFIGFWFVYPLAFGTTNPCDYSRFNIFPDWSFCNINHLLV
ncbi:PMT-domain-containing protein [Coemansia reversa NRRL 1564]|uniref:Dolichyl-phosphate-mannose--protein mannosyltransferase n=1 Tax=Coemansia reversa (strain ATCC 12441 / NRRL 1564) TaxID=763665 RepID=A0A2G5BE48_COERN|nr:PMT-domain-containing protein [Coemansia reversa NRRL 1564]|eukprot:PIA17296.1 PMT-domain-containing protein [Coemansia reversa NRRL 1564]